MEEFILVYGLGSRGIRVHHGREEHGSMRRRLKDHIVNL